VIAQDRMQQLMIEALEEAKHSKAEDQGVHPQVGAILADANGEIIGRAHRGMSGHGDHAEFLLLEKAKEKNQDLKEATLLVTLEPCTARGPGKTPCVDHILKSGVQDVYIGMLDPNPQICGRGETKLRYSVRVERFPDELVKEIQRVNKEFVELHRAAHLSRSSLYVSTQISDLIREHLKRDGWEMDELPSDWDVTIEDLDHYCASALKMSFRGKMRSLVHGARGYAFDAKYADYTYDTDVRGLGGGWREEFREVMRTIRAEDYPRRKVINVGIGNGLEGKGLFDSVDCLTAVDIAPKSLNSARRNLPKAKFLLQDAEDLKEVETGSEDIYVSLRTYQSSYFGVTRALHEAYRVVRQGGVVVISIANGFLTEESGVVPGLVIPRSNVVSRDRPFEVAEQIRRKLTLMRFEEVGVRTGLYEIYVYGRRGR
jgi:pyrimidine deaminase RibD-like protein/SAM-dependent methyltransferase